MGVSRRVWSAIGSWAVGGCAAEPAFAGVYRLRGALGSGGTGNVYEAFRTGGGAHGVCALKIFHDAISTRPEAVSMALRQVALLRAADAPGLVEMRAAGVFQGRLFIEMELLRGAPLSTLLQANAMPMTTRRAILRDVLKCLRKIHARGGAHGDIKPGNVMLTEAGVVKIIDFGWPNAFPSDCATSMAACVTPAYATPERLAGTPLAPWDDLYAFACLIHLVLTERHPFGGRSGAEARSSGLRPNSLRALLRPRSCDVLERVLSFDTCKRPEDMADVIAQLDEELGT